MSEIVKCPLCGKNVKQSIWRPEYEGCGGSVVVTVKCCGIEAATIPLWNQYAAAMELARAEFELDRCNPEYEHQWQFYIEEARKRVLEVFGGE